MLTHTTFVQKASSLLDQTRKNYLFYLDFAEFKMVNHHYGHKQGDALLKETVDYIESIPTVLCCERVFSDHILFVVSKDVDQDDEELLNEFDAYGANLVSRLNVKYPACIHRICCGISKIDSTNLIEAIDLASYARLEIKKSADTGYHLMYDTDKEKLLRRFDLEQEIMLALQKQNFRFYLQPKVDLLTGQIIGAEALARRVDDDGNVIYPDSFIAILEKNGGIINLDFLIFEQVCQYMSELLTKGFPVVCTSINLSRLHLQNIDHVDQLHEIAQKYQIPPALLDFELTESIALNEFDSARAFGNRLASLGYCTSIDDFGSGYAGINIWQELTFNTLKLDRKFLVDEPVVKARNTAIIRGIVEIAQNLNIDVLCEGVEREDQCQRLLRLGCRYAQGFYFSPAISPEEFYKIYQEQRGHYSVPFQNNG